MQRDSGKNISLFFSIIALVEIYLTYPTKETFHRCSNAGSVKDGVCAALWRKSRTPLAFSTRILICFLEVEAEFISQNATLEICFKTGTHPIWPGQAAASLSLGFQFPGTFARPVYPTRFGGKRGFPSWERSCMLPSLPTPRPTAQRESQEARPRWGPGARCARRLPSGRREQALARPLGWKCGLDSAAFSPRLVGAQEQLQRVPTRAGRPRLRGAASRAVLTALRPLVRAALSGRGVRRGGEPVVPRAPGWRRSRLGLPTQTFEKDFL